MTFLQAILGSFVIYAAVGFFSYVRSGVLRIGETEEDTIEVKRQERPFAFWAFVVFFYSVLGGMAAAIPFVP